MGNDMLLEERDISVTAAELAEFGLHSVRDTTIRAAAHARVCSQCSPLVGHLD